MSMRIPAGLPGNDIHQWLNGGWIIVDTDAGQVVGKFEMIDNTTIRYRRDDYVHECTADKVMVHWPTCGAVNLEGYAVVLTRNSRQQYRRTFNSRVLALSVPRKWDVMKKVGIEVATTVDDQAVVEAAFNPRYFSYEQALGKLDNGWVTVALNPYLVVAGTPDDHLVYYRNELVARIEGADIAPIGDDPRIVSRLLKFFDERVTLCLSTKSAITTERSPEEQASASGLS